ncbi:5124_t:CDS:1 [Dentiscutata erythropus]|uniref:5124_t:CDS:1 n=1 Tax=Dentiscutata erythropus TaxID=1348616 RepID=A0A9N9H456_9GLOM|nr:5124_t:CDS:1 [Dentiscutata erythropus]
MVATPKITNKKVTSSMEQIKLSFGNDSNKVGMMSSTFPDISHYMDAITHEPSSLKSGGMNDVTLFDPDEWLANDLEQFISEGEDGLLFPSETSTTSYDVSPALSSSIPTPSLPFDSTIASREFDSPLFGHPTFSTSPILEPAIGFFPELSDGNNPKLHLASIVPSVTIPVDPLSLSIRQPGLTSALNIPWGSDVTNTPNIVSDGTTSFVNSLINTRNTRMSPLSSTKSPPAVIVPSKPSQTKPASGRSRKRSENDVEKDPETVSEELAIKRAKNTDAARRSRLRKVMKMDSLEKQVNVLKVENSELQTRIAVLESEKKGLEEKNIDKDNRIRLLEQQLTEAHERLINRSS